ncbi:hypothetical protein RchiOBHm_Chr1g0382121 [Rosa chinensis]|uniref:Uncharacterized protein n=1 Tax=Rosa chinensis TaxID=74649 RepID=A0A2P6SPA1_ROSCH|nr:hypothetical protein RchiOBHm_Chr1g0382121 [Rosa chinensis]
MLGFEFIFEIFEGFFEMGFRWSKSPYLFTDFRFGIGNASLTTHLFIQRGTWGSLKDLLEFIGF